MLYGPLTIDRSDGLKPTVYARIWIKTPTDNTDRRWIIHGETATTPITRHAIAAYRDPEMADRIETDLDNGGLWYQYGRCFSRCPRT